MATFGVISQQALKGFSIVFNSTIKKLDSLINELTKIPKGLIVSDIEELLIKKKIYNDDEADEITKLLYVLYRLKVKSNKSTQEVVSGIFDDLGEIKQNDFKVREDYRKYFEKLLSIANIGITLKSLGLAYEYGKVYVDSRIITDIRPSFDDNIDDKIEAAVMIHNLKIEYHVGQNPFHEEIYLALDSNDLIKLKEQILRAEKKDKTIKNTFSKSNITFIKTSED